MRNWHLKYGNPACLGGSRDTCQSIVMQSPFVQSLHNARKTSRRSLAVFWKTIFTCHFSFILPKNHMGSQAAFYFIFFITPQLLGHFILPRLQMKKCLFVCSKSKVIIKYIKNMNSIYLNYFCFLTALFWWGAERIAWHAPDNDISHASMYNHTGCD